MFGVTSGTYGMVAYEWKDGSEETNALYGLPLSHVLGSDPLPTGTTIEVDLRIVKRGKHLRTNPWLRKRR
jgi:hypothetical protein